MDRPYEFTSESVSMGHPDKVADQVSDAILDAVLAQDPTGRVACETLVTTNQAVIAGEISFNGRIDAEAIAREVIEGIGYDDAKKGFDARKCDVAVYLDEQSPDIGQGVDRDGAGDQGLMFGYACRETATLMPLPIDLAHRLVQRQAEVRVSGAIPGLRPDAKSQVTVHYDGGAPRSIKTLVLSTQHDGSWSSDAKQAELRRAVAEQILKPVLGEWWSDDITVHVNPTGRFELGGPHGDCGLTGRKIIVDTYGGRGRHGGGAFSGKDATKVDRSAAYMARYIAKNIVAAELADVCEVQLSYAIGVAEPTSVLVDCQGTARIDEETIERLVRSHFPLTPRAIIEHLGLRAPIFRPTACHGHFGREPGEGGEGTFSWERTDRAAKLREAAGVPVGASA